MGAKKIKVPVFGGYLVLVDTPREAQAAVKKYLHDNQSSETFRYWGAVFSDLDYENFIVLYVNRPRHKGSVISTVVHEAVHAAVSIMTRAGIPVNAENEEVTAYLTGWVYEMWIKHMET